MKPSSLLGLALELAGALASPGPFPADARVGKFFRARRFLGSHDRRFLGSVAYAWLRQVLRARVRWAAWAQAAGLSPEPPPTTVRGGEFLPDLIALGRDGLLPWELPLLLEAAREIAALPHPRAEPPQIVLPSPETLTEALLRIPGSAERLLGLDVWPEDPTERLVAETGLPSWLALRLREERGAEIALRLARALAEPASVDIRVSLRGASREEVRALLEEELGTELRPTPLSPLGLRMAGRRDLAGTVPGRRGWIEVEDEGSQIVVCALDVRPGATVIDACAGAGGKSLGLADALFPPGAPERSGAPRSRLYAVDVDPQRLHELRERARRAGVLDSLRIVVVDPEGPLPTSLPQADLVLVDAPCTGLGTLRRNPELKLRHGPEAVERFAKLQVAILERWAPQVRPGGTLVYATCSILSAENEGVARAFSTAHPEFIPTRSLWADRNLPFGCLGEATIRLDPLLSGTDGFFIAMWNRGQPGTRVR